MYLTRMKLDTEKRLTAKALYSPNLFHGAVESSFQGERKRHLWRIDRLNGNCYLMMVSEEKPDLNKAAEQFGIPEEENSWESRDYSAILDRIHDGTQWQFRLTANPTVSCSNVTADRGTVHACSSVKYQEEWLRKRADAHGFQLAADSFTVNEVHWLRFQKHGSGKPVSLLSVSFEGILTVTNAELFCHTLTSGIGRGKAYGLGMMTVVRPDRKV